MSKGFVGRSQAIAAIALAALLCALALSPAHAGGPPCTVSNTGTSGDDRLCGTSGNNNMDGLGGDDRMRGLAGNDTINGNSGNDSLFGGTGNDTIVGGTGGDNALDGEDGNDVLTPGSGIDAATFGGSGDDELRLRDGAPDFLAECGAGTDFLDLDLTDAALFAATPILSCERVVIGAVDEGPNVVISPRPRRVGENGKAKLRLRCPGALSDPCAGKLTIGRTPKRQGSAKHYGIDPGDSEKVAAKLSRRDRRKLHRRDRLGVRAISVEAGEFGDKTTAQKLTLIARH